LSSLLEIRELSFAYGDLRVLWDVDLEVREGEIVSVVGANGAGKSTLLKNVSRLVTGGAGSIRFAGKDLGALRSHEVVALGVVQVPEGRRIFPEMTVLENLTMGAYVSSARSDLKRNLDRAYALFPKLHQRRKQLGGTMSGGEQQMLAMARGLACDPAVLMLDELSMGLAPLIVEELYEIVAQIARSGVSILVIEQFARTVLGVADLAAIMVNGKVLRVGAPSEIEHELSAAYLGG